MRRWHIPDLTLVIAICLSNTIVCLEASACTCEANLSPCKEVASSELVLIGTVKWIEPITLSRWNLTNTASMQRLNHALEEAQRNPSPESLNRLKDMYGKEFSNLEDVDKSRLRAAKTVYDVLSVFDGLMDRGILVHLEVKSLYKHEDDDDRDPPSTSVPPAGRKADSDDADKEKPPEKSTPKIAGAGNQKDLDDDNETRFDVWTPFSDCGLDFQSGETYLVYAKNDESSGRYFTSSCTRTRRLSEAGADLSYLYFYKSEPDRSSQLEGFTTLDRTASLEFDAMHDPEAVRLPVANLVLELRSKGLTRYATSNRDGRFVYDGLPEGDYEITAFSANYPWTVEQLVARQTLHIEAKGCARQILVLPPATVK